jgi:cytochrome P450
MRQEATMHEQSDPIVPEMTDDFDIHAPAFALDPYPAYRQLREECPVQHSTRHGGYWLLTRYEDVRRAATDWRTYTSSVVGVTAIPIITQRTEPQLPIELDPPLHSRYRALVNPVFSPERIDELHPTVTAIAAELIDRLLERGEGDLVADYAVPLSVRTLAAFTGLPEADADRWVAWIRRMFDVRDRADGARASQEFGVYIDELIVARRHHPSGDFISLLMASEVEGHRLTDKEVHSFCTVQFGAGFETTADAISASLHYLAEHPADRARLFSDADLIPPAVEEFLRYVTPIQIFGRNATRAVELRGRTIGEGDVVALSFGSANHDPTAFSDPDRCIFDRPLNRHLAFGAGLHLCLGSPVARLEMAITLQAFAERMPEFRLIPDRPAAWKTRGDRRGLSELPVVLG